LGDDHEDCDSDDDEYDLTPDLEDSEDEYDDEEMGDVLDLIKGTPRVAELDSDDEGEEAPKLVAAESKKTKGKNKRPAEEESEGLDELIAKEEAKVSKKQAKKLKNNKGEAIAAEEKAKEAKADKKVQFAKNLEQGPTGPAKDKAEKKDSDKKAASTVKVVQGVTIDDRKVGTGRTVKSGDKVGMRYIGKLQNGKVFDCK
jgi:FK506-binding nuclear protein